jgi:hypothetical protein
MFQTRILPLLIMHYKSDRNTSGEDKLTPLPLLPLPAALGASTCSSVTIPHLFIRTFWAAAMTETLRPVFFAKRALHQGGPVVVCLTRRRGGCMALASSSNGLATTAQKEVGPKMNDGLVID